MGHAHDRYLPDLDRAGDVEWTLRYGSEDDVVALRYVAASYVSAYAAITAWCEHPTRPESARALRECYAAARRPTRGRKVPPGPPAQAD